MVRKSLSRVLTQHAQSLCSVHRITHTCPVGGEEEDLRGGQGKEMTLVQTPEEKKYWDLQNGTMVTFSSLMLVVSVENVSIF